ncbi:MAG TPA: hypothetical protein VMU18_13105, partial [Rhodoblastus sp.]|nr:hypothetical protein [Rhodoblastus sp.]
INLIESSIRAKLFATIPGASPESTAAGVALAHRLVEPVLRDLRQRAEARARAEADVNAQKSEPKPTEVRPAGRGRDVARLN